MKAQQDRESAMQNAARERYLLGDFAQNHIKAIHSLATMLQDDVQRTTRCGHDDWDAMDDDDLDTIIKAAERLMTTKGGD